MDRQASWHPDPDSGIAMRWIEANGLTFEVAEAGQGERLALCLHGFPELHYSWRHQMPALAALGYRVWAPNLRGYGATDQPLGRDSYRLETLAAELAQVVLEEFAAAQVEITLRKRILPQTDHVAVRLVRYANKGL